MNKDDYTSKIRNLLDQDDYKITKGNPTNRFTNSIKKTLEDILQTNNISLELAKNLIPKNPTIPQIYGLPKIHKTEVPLRPIVCTIGSATYNLAKEINRILFPLVGKTDSYVKTSSHFVSFISHLHVPSTSKLLLPLERHLEDT